MDSVADVKPELVASLVNDLSVCIVTVNSPPLTLVDLSCFRPE